MLSTPTTIGELFRSLGLTLIIRTIEGDEESWACTLVKPDGTSHEIDAVSFFDVDPETGDEWTVEPTPSRVLSVLAGGDVEDEDADDAVSDDEAAGETAAAARAFLGDEAYELLLALDEADAD